MKPILPLFVAYLDPGTGSMLVYFFLGILAMLLYSAKDTFYKVKSLFTGGKANKDLRNITEDVLWYSEGKQYWHVFLPVIEEFEKLSIASAYYTSDKEDPALQSNFKHLRVAWIGDGLKAFFILNRLNAKVVVMTTPQLDVLQLKRSKNVRHYSHLVHAPTDVHLYKKFAFDYFDSVLCSGEHQIDSIRMLEEKRNLEKKMLLKTGLTYYDIMFKNKPKKTKKTGSGKSKEKTILIAPTWGRNSMLVKFGIAPLKTLLKNGYRIILRPHPQMYVSQKDLIQKLEDELSQYSTLEINRDFSPDQAIAKSDLLISDISGIIFDYLFVGEKPIIVVNEKVEHGGFEGEDIGFLSWEENILENIATLVDQDNIDRLSDIVKKTLKKKSQNNIEKLRKESLFHFGKAGKIAAKQILEIAEKC